MDNYSILGVSRSASDAEIKSAYKRKVVEWHPDRNKSPEAPEMIKKINKAYEVLSDPQKKSIYDQVGHDAYEKRGYGSASGGPQGYPGAGYSTGPGGFNVDFDFGGGVGVEDIFESFFGGGRRGRGRPRRQVYQMNLTFEEAIKGVTKETVIEGKSREIKIPAGVDTNMQIRFTDFDVVVQVRPHAFFKREGQDIFYEKQISFVTAVLGGTVNVPLVEGSIDLKVAPGTPAGKMVRLTGKGIPFPNQNRWGDFYVTYKVHVPTRVSSKAKKLLEELSTELA